LLQAIKTPAAIDFSTPLSNPSEAIGVPFGPLQALNQQVDIEIILGQKEFLCLPIFFTVLANRSHPEDIVHKREGSF